MGIVVVPIFCGLVYLAVKIASKLNRRILETVDFKTTWNQMIIIAILRLLFFTPFAVLSFYFLDTNFPSGANLFGNDKSPWLFALAPFLAGFTFTLSKSFSYLILKAFEKSN